MFLINMLKSLTDKVDSIQEQMSDINRDINPKNEAKRNLEMKNSVTEYKNALLGLLVDWT